MRSKNITTLEDAHTHTHTHTHSMSTEHYRQSTGSTHNKQNCGHNNQNWSSITMMAFADSIHYNPWRQPLTISSYQSVPPPSSQSQVGIGQQNTIVGERGHTVSVYIINTLSDPSHKKAFCIPCCALILWQYILKGTNAMYPSRVYMDHKIPCTLGCALGGYIQLPSGTHPIHPIDIHGTTITCTSNVSTHHEY